VIRIESTATRNTLAQEQVFEFQSIHGIKVHNTCEDQSQVGYISLLIWGGRRVALGRIKFSQAGSIDRSQASPLAIGPEFETADWILDATFALSKHAPSIAYLVTAHNDVFAIRSDALHDLHVSISQVTSGLKSMLYSAHIKPISGTSILVAAGTVFGEIIVWSCYRGTSQHTKVEEGWHGRTYNVFQGHNGSIFGVCLSDAVELSGDHRPRRLLASCSDDRTIRLWDVSDCNYSLEAASDVGKQHRETARETGFVSLVNAGLAITWGHSSRIWGVDFIHPNTDFLTNPLQLFSRGEDATSQVWNLAWEVPTISTDGADLGRRRFRLFHASTHQHHSGKHIWSHAHILEGSGPLIFTGGGDGRIIARSITPLGLGGSYLNLQIPSCDLFGTAKAKSTTANHLTTNYKDSIKQYVFVSGDVILATTNQGNVIKGIIETHGQNPCQSLGINWTLLINAMELHAFTVMASDTTEGVVYLSSVTGEVWIYQHAVQSIGVLATTDEKISNIFTSQPSTSNDEISAWHLLLCSTICVTARLLQITRSGGEPESLRVSKNSVLCLPPNFQPTAFLEVHGGNLLVLGSRSGAIAIYHDAFHESKTADQIFPSLCLRHVHASDTVTHLHHLPVMRPSEQDEPCHEFLSTGRDGSYAIHIITFQECESGGLTPLLTTLHRSCPPFGPNIEGASVILTDSGGTNLLLYGFRGKNFVVWNESTHSQVVSIPCGGAHRNWAYFLNHPTSQLGTINQGGCFVWTKAGVFNMAKLGPSSHEIIQPGGHGREIKAMAVYKETSSYNALGTLTRRLFATGAEDTAIRLWAVTEPQEYATNHKQCESPEDNALCIQILKKHTTGIQGLSFGKNFLFSSAGCEELFIWKINFGVSVVDIGSVFQAAAPKYATASDLRITSFGVIHVPSVQRADSILKVEHFVIYATYSNSMIRVFKYTDNLVLSAEDRFQLLGEGFYNTTCLTNISLLPRSAPWFLTASTNGAIAVWPDVDHHVNFRDSPAKLSHAAEHNIHQNAILALYAICVGPGYYLLLTGGDDNAFGITIMLESASNPMIYNSGYKNSLLPPRFRTLLIPGAHAAAITTLEILDSKREAGLLILIVVSTGNDQRLKTWRITVNVDELSKNDYNPRMSADAFGPEVLGAIEVELVKEMWTSVADASSMIVIPDADDRDTAGRLQFVEVGSGRGKRLMIAGIGMEMMRIDGAGQNDESRTGQASDARPIDDYNAW